MAENQGRPIWQIDTASAVRETQKLPIGDGGNDPKTLTVAMIRDFIRDGMATVAQIEEQTRRIDEINDIEKANKLREQLIQAYGEELKKIKTNLLRNTVRTENASDLADLLLSRVNDVEEALKNVSGAGEGSAIVVDSKMSATSKNPVQNRVIYQYLQEAKNNSERAVYTIEEYMAMKNAGTLERIFYAVYKDGELYRMYFYDTLIMKKAEDGETVTVGAAFPLVFPIIFA